MKHRLPAHFYLLTRCEGCGLTGGCSTQTPVSLLKPVCKSTPSNKILSESQKLSFLNSALLPLGKGHSQNICLPPGSSAAPLIPLSLNMRQRNWAKGETVGMVCVWKLRSRPVSSWKHLCAVTQALLTDRSGFKSWLWACYLVLINHMVFLVVMLIGCKNSVR